MSEAPENYWNPAGKSGPYKTVPENPEAIAELANTSGRYLLYSMLLFLVPAFISVYPVVPLALSLALTLPGAIIAIKGLKKTNSLSFPGASFIHLYANALFLPVIGGVIMQSLAVQNTGDAEGATYLAWFSLLLMFALSLFGLNKASRLKPQIVNRTDRKVANFALAALAGTTIAGIFLPLTIFMTISFLIIGVWAFWIINILPILGLMVTAKFLLKHFQDVKKSPHSTIPKTSCIIQKRPFFLLTGALALFTFIAINSIVTIVFFNSI